MSAIVHKRIVGRVWCYLAKPSLWFGLLSVAYFLFFAALTLASHNAFRTSALDLGIYDQVVWNTAHGRILAYSAEPQYGRIFLAAHLQPILILLAPLYWLWSDVRALILLQSLVIAASALPVYALARSQLHDPWAGLAFAFAYLMLPALQAVNVWIFHPESLEPLLLLGSFFLLEAWRGRVTVRWLSRRLAAYLFGVAIILALACKEDVSLVVGAMGLYLLVVRRERRLGLVLAGAAALWFGIGVFGVIPYFRGGKPSPFLAYYAAFGQTPQEILVTLLTRPDLVARALFTPANALMLLSLLLPLAFLPLLGLPLLLVAMPVLVIYGLSGNEFMQRLEEFQYAAPVVSFVILAAIYGLVGWHRSPRLARWLPVALGLLVAASLAYQGVRGFTPLSRVFEWPAFGRHERIGHELLRLIPADATVVAQDRLYPHLSQRQNISFLWPADAAVEYIFLDISHPTFGNFNDIHVWLREEIQKRQDYGLIAGKDGYLLLKRGAPQAQLPEEFYDFARAQAPVIQHPLVADFEGGLRFLGYDLLPRRDWEPHLVLYWTLTEAVRKDYLLRLYFLDQGGRVMGQTAFQQPTLVWYPSSRWHPGETVRVLVNTLTLPTASQDLFVLGLGVIDRSGPGGSEVPLRIRPVEGAAPPRLLEGGTILWLGELQRQFGATWLVEGL